MGLRDDHARALPCRLDAGRTRDEPVCGKCDTALLDGAPVDLRDLEITVRKALANVAKMREMDRQRMAAERARTNLSRYFSPNIVELLAAQDEPLGAGRRETVAGRR